MTSNSERILADTHALVWHLTQSRRLSATARGLLQAVDRGEIELVVPTIVLAESLWISERRNPGITFEEILMHIDDMPRTVIATLDLPVLREAKALPQDLELHDRLIAATARVYAADFISRDEKLRSFVQTIW